MTDAARLVELLREVAADGAPAQQVRARDLVARLDGGDVDAELLAAASQLLDAYRNDPYLWR